MRIRVRFLCMFLMFFLAGSAVSIYVGHKVRVAEERLASAKEAVQMETLRLQALEAEWSFLNRPERLERYAAQYLGMGKPDQISAVEANVFQNTGETLVEHLFYNAAYAVPVSQKRNPAYVAEKPVRSAE